MYRRSHKFSTRRLFIHNLILRSRSLHIADGFTGNIRPVRFTTGGTTNDNTTVTTVMAMVMATTSTDTK